MCILTILTCGHLRLKLHKEANKNFEGFELTYFIYTPIKNEVLLKLCRIDAAILLCAHRALKMRFGQGATVQQVYHGEIL